MRRILFSTLAAVTFAVGLPACSGEAGPAGTISGGALAARIAAGTAPVILDVRSDAEFRAGHIPGAIHVPHDQLEARLDELPADASEEIVAHCQSGRRASMAEAVLADAGYTEVRDLEGHWAAWQEAGHPVEGGSTR
jgi:hydroxyacylglutathione hydrolase